MYCPDREAEELAAPLPGEDPDRLEAKLPQREIGELGCLAGPVKGHALHAAIGELAKALSERLPGPAIEVQGVNDVGVAQPGLLGEALPGQHVPQPLSRSGLARELADFNETFPGQTLEIKVRQPEGDAQPLGEIALGQGSTLADGGKDLEIALPPAFHHDVHKLNTRPLRRQEKRPRVGVTLS